MKLHQRALSSSERSANQQECPSSIRRTAFPPWVRKMGGNHSQTTLVFNRRGDFRLDSLSRFHLNTQWKRYVTSHDEVILSFTLKSEGNLHPALLYPALACKRAEPEKFKYKDTEIGRRKNASFAVQYCALIGRNFRWKNVYFRAWPHLPKKTSNGVTVLPPASCLFFVSGSELLVSEVLLLLPHSHSKTRAK